MLSHTFKVLEYEKIKQQLAIFASSSLGKEKVEALTPSTDYEEVKHLQATTDEAMQVIRLKGTVPLGGATDVRGAIKRAAIGSVLSASELIGIGGIVYVSRNMERFISDLTGEEIEVPILQGLVDSIIDLSQIEKNINRCIDDSGHVMDAASETLRGIRSQMRGSEARIRERLEGVLRSKASMLSDTVITIRNDRYVIPAKQESRGAFGGIVHDQSSSGQTLFIEPQVVVELNNQLQEAKMREKQEIERILRDLSSQVGEEADHFLNNMTIITELDFAFAKGFYSASMKGSKPKINNDGYIRLVKARHPLIPVEEVVANDIELGKDFTAIVITGPNTGGKTVTLKTLGLCILMAQSGLQIPALDGSEICMFQKVFADIGDEQSIEQSLSTFSSHMVNIVGILNHVDHESLVLFDELGAGTDPQEGAALAISLLDEVTNRGARVMATTHYPELKAYGYNRDGVVNASVEFDVETLRPTYRLLIGVPGRSNAFEISKRLGLGESIIGRAKEYVSTDSNKVENMIASLEESSKAAERDWQEADYYRKQAEKLHKELQRQIIAFNEKREEMFRRAEEKAAEKVKDSLVEAEEVMKELRLLRQSSIANVKEHELIEAKARLEGAIPKLATAPKPKAAKPSRKLQPGDEVNVVSIGRKGQLLEQASDKEWQVQLGIMKMKVNDADLELIKAAEPAKQPKALATVRGRDAHVLLELDLRGERYEDAILRLEKYIDDALLANYAQVSIIHGKGTGALRQGVQDFLKRHRSVKNYRYGGTGEGGLGVTVVELK